MHPCCCRHRGEQTFTQRFVQYNECNCGRTRVMLSIRSRPGGGVVRCLEETRCADKQKTDKHNQFPCWAPASACGACNSTVSVVLIVSRTAVTAYFEDTLLATSVAYALQRGEELRNTYLRPINSQVLILMWSRARSTLWIIYSYCCMYCVSRAILSLFIVFRVHKYVEPIFLNTTCYAVLTAIFII